MTIFEKLNLTYQDRIVVLNAPPSFEPELAALQGVTILRSESDLDEETDFSLAFVTTLKEIETLGPAAAKAKGDPMIWFAYPKTSSQNYASEITRDNGWQLLGKLGFEVVRNVSIDDDWTAMRFRRAEFIKTMTRAEKGRMTEVGKARLRKK